MTRFVLLLAGAIVLLILVWPLLRGRALPVVPRGGALDELVKDPVCHSYIVRSRALARVQDGVLRHFCSKECAQQFVPGGSGSRG
jgi:YHS domain-containing protein